MSRTWIRTLLSFVAIVVLLISAPVFAEDVSALNALSPWSEEATYVFGRVQDPVKIIENIAKSPLMQLDRDLSDLALFLKDSASVVSGFKDIAFSFGVTRGIVQAQVACVIEGEPESLVRVSQGKLSKEDMDYFTQFNLPLEGPFNLEASGIPFYKFLVEIEDELSVPICFAVKDNMLLLGMSPRDLESSLASLGDAAKRLEPNRRFDAPSFVKFQDMTGILPIVLAFSGLPIDVKTFREGEVALGLAEDKLEFDVYTNLLPALVDQKIIDKISSFKVADLPLVGGGRLLGATCLPVNYDLFMELVKLSGEEDPVRDIAIAMDFLKNFGISEDDVRKLIDGTFSIVLGGAAKLGEIGMPGFYMTLTSPGIADPNLVNKLAAASAGSGAPFAEEARQNWSKLLFMEAPVTLTAGVKGNALVLGATDRSKLDERPEYQGALAELNDVPNVHMLFYLDIPALDEELKKIEEQGDSIAGIVGENPNNYIRDLAEIRQMLSGVKDVLFYDKDLAEFRFVVHYK